MGDHRIRLTADFEMHGHKAKLDQWVNYSEKYPDEIRDWLVEQIRLGMNNYFDAKYDADMLRQAEEERREREDLARLKAKYETET